MHIHRISLQDKMPNNKHIAWAEPNGDIVDLKINVRGKWTPVSGSGDSSGSSTTISPNITYDELQALYDSGVTKVTVEGLGEGVLRDIENYIIIETKDSAIIYSSRDSLFFPVKYGVQISSILSDTDNIYKIESVINVATRESIDLHTLPFLTDKIVNKDLGIYHLTFCNLEALKDSHESIWIGSDYQGNLKKLVVMGTKEIEFE